VQAREVRVDPGPGDRVRATLRRRALERVQRTLLLPEKGPRARDVVAREGVVRPHAQALLERVERHAEGDAARIRPAEREEHASDVDVQLHDDALLERVVHAPQERELVPVFLERLLVSPLQGEKDAAAHVRTDDEDSLPPGEAALLELDRLKGRAVREREVPEERGHVRELERVPAALGVPLERPLEARRRLGEHRLPEEVRAPERRVRAPVLRVHLDGPPDRLEAALLASQAHERRSQLPPGAREARLEPERALEGLHGLLEELRHHEVRRFRVVRDAELEPGPRVPGIERDRALEEEDRAVHGLAALGAEIHEALRERLVGVDDVRRLPALRGGLRDDVEPVGELAHDAVLQVEELGHGAVDLHRREDLARLDVARARRDADAVAEPLEAARHDPARADLAPEAGGELGLAV
jgi:hypothetical protein